MRALWARWNTLWFAPVDARPLGAMRITLGLLLLWWWAWLWPELGLLFHDQGAIDPRLIGDHWTPYRWDVLQGWSLAQLQLGHVVGAALIVLYTLGLGTPVVKFAVAAALVAVLHRSPWVWNGGDRMIRIWVLTMALTPCGAAYSVDAWLKARRGQAPHTTVPVLGLRLVQLQLMVMYTWTGIDKLQHAAWWDGSAIYWAVSDGNFSRAPWLLDPLLQTALGWPISAVLVVATLVFEAGFVPLVLWPTTRRATLIAGALLHAGIFVTMSVGMFGPASVWGYQAFLSDRWPPPRPTAPAQAPGVRAALGL